MFNKQFKAVFYVLAQAFMKLYHMPADWKESDEHQEFTGADMMARIDAADQPDAGTDLPDATTNRPDQMFGEDGATLFGADCNVTTVDANTGGVTIRPGGGLVTAVAPVYAMTEKAGGMSREQFAGWTDAQLIEHGYMVDVTPKPAAVAPPPPPAPVAPPAPSSSAATTTPGDIEVDKDGIPWDGRIHSSSRKMTDKGIWSRRKNVPDATFNQIRATLMQAAAAGGGATPTPFAPIAQQPVAPVPPAPPAAVAPPPPAVAPPPPAAPGTASITPEARAAIEQALSAAAGAAKVPANFSELMVWVRDNGVASHMATVTGLMGLPGLGVLSHPEHAPRVPEAHAHFMALKG